MASDSTRRVLFHVVFCDVLGDLALTGQYATQCSLAIALLPMLLPLRGLLHGRRYTHAWASFLALPYFAFGVDAVVHRTQMKWLGAILVLLSALWFCGCMFYSRYHPQHQPVDSDTEH